jgi:hypothetical protein
MLCMLADKTIPMPGDVQLLTGGPPCQVCKSSRGPSEVHGAAEHHAAQQQPSLLLPSVGVPSPQWALY